MAVAAMVVAKEVAMEVEAAMVEVATVVVAMEEVEAAMEEVATAAVDKEVCIGKNGQRNSGA